jgi:hypothetical protein
MALAKANGTGKHCGAALDPFPTRLVRNLRPMARPHGARSPRPEEGSRLCRPVGIARDACR